MCPLTSSQAKGRDNELAKIQTFCLDAFTPLARHTSESNSDNGQLLAAEYLEMVCANVPPPPPPCWVDMFDITFFKNEY